MAICKIDTWARQKRSEQLTSPQLRLAALGFRTECFGETSFSRPSGGSRLFPDFRPCDHVAAFDDCAPSPLFRPPRSEKNGENWLRRQRAVPQHADCKGADF
jgi:hypothetical protein